MGAEERNRLRWQCRRGLLELDVIRARAECTDSRLAEVLGWMRKS